MLLSQTILLLFLCDLVTTSFNKTLQTRKKSLFLIGSFIDPSFQCFF